METEKIKVEVLKRIETLLDKRAEDLKEALRLDKEGNHEDADAYFASSVRHLTAINECKWFLDLLSK